MSFRHHISLRLPAGLLAMTVAGLLPLRAAPPAKTEVPPPVSKFVVPGKPSEGRDPFFPDSLRPYSSGPKNEARGPDLSEVALKSIMGTAPNLFAIINNHTFAAGDDGDITTKSGQRLHINCVDINAPAGTATIEAGGARIVLRLPGGL